MHKDVHPLGNDDSTDTMQLGELSGATLTWEDGEGNTQSVTFD